MRLQETMTENIDGEVYSYNVVYQNQFCKELFAKVMQIEFDENRVSRIIFMSKNPPFAYEFYRYRGFIVGVKNKFDINTGYPQSQRIRMFTNKGYGIVKKQLELNKFLIAA